MFYIVNYITSEKTCTSELETTVLYSLNLLTKYAKNIRPRAVDLESMIS